MKLVQFKYTCLNLLHSCLLSCKPGL
jgi:hypothetical protein